MVLSALGCLASVLVSSPALAQQRTFNQQKSAFAYCQRVITDDNPGMVPASLLPAFRRAFEFSGPVPSQGLRFRCYQGTVMGCTIGANPNCGKANTSTSSQGGDEW